MKIHLTINRCDSTRVTQEYSISSLLRDVLIDNLEKETPNLFTIVYDEEEFPCLNIEIQDTYLMNGSEIRIIEKDHRKVFLSEDQVLNLKRQGRDLYFSITDICLHDILQTLTLGTRNDILLPVERKMFTKHNLVPNHLLPHFRILRRDECNGFDIIRYNTESCNHSKLRFNKKHIDFDFEKLYTLSPKFHDLIVEHMSREDCSFVVRGLEYPLFKLHIFSYSLEFLRVCIEFILENDYAEFTMYEYEDATSYFTLLEKNIKFNDSIFFNFFHLSDNDIYIDPKESVERTLGFLNA